MVQSHLVLCTLMKRSGKVRHTGPLSALSPRPCRPTRRPIAHQKMSVPARSVVVISELAGMVLGMSFHPFPNMQRMITEVNLPPVRA
jgi:hypothetical protein